MIALGRGRPAEADLRRVVRLRPGHAASRNNLGAALSSQGHDAEAARLTAEAAALARDPTAAPATAR